MKMSKQEKLKQPATGLPQMPEELKQLFGETPKTVPELLGKMAAILGRPNLTEEQKKHLAGYLEMVLLQQTPKTT